MMKKLWYEAAPNSRAVFVGGRGHRSGSILVGMMMKFLMMMLRLIRSAATGGFVATGRS